MAAAEGRLPAWAEAGPGRRRHMHRVASLLDEWGGALGLRDADRRRWRAAGYLHDVLREAPPRTLLPLVAAELRELPGPLLHGPAGAERLRREGVEDEPLLRAVAYHTIGHPSLDLLGRALFAADFLEPGRRSRPKWRAAHRRRFPESPVLVVQEVARERIRIQLEAGRPLPPQTIEFWNTLVGADGDGVASA